jgi:hypothetical protein
MAARLDTSEGLRALAQRARRIAVTIPADEAALQLLAFAQELECRAELIEMGVEPVPAAC